MSLLPISGALGFNRSRDKSTSDTTSTSRTTGTTALSAMTAQQRAQLDSALSALMGTELNTAEDERYSKDAAIADSQGIVSAIFDNFSKTVLPQIYTGMHKAGSYNSTGSQLLANDAYAQTAAKAAGLVMDNIQKYADIGMQNKQLNAENYRTNLTSLLGLFGVAENATKSETIDQTTTGKSNTRASGTSTSVGGSVTGGFKFS
jgi:hypothetical protein